MKLKRILEPSKSRMRLVWVLGALLAVGAEGIGYKSYVTVGTHNLWDGIGRDWKGNVYVGNGNKTAGQANGVLYRYNHKTDKLEKVVDCKAVSQKAGNWKTKELQEKIHTTIKQGSDGKMYFATHSNLHKPPEYPGKYRGGHFYRYDPETGIGEDLSAPNVVLQEGILDVAMDLKRQYVYGISWPGSNIYQLHLPSRKHKIVGNSKGTLGSVTRNIFSDNEGKIYVPAKTNEIMVFDPARQSFEKPIPFNGEWTQIVALVKSMSGDSIYFIGLVSSSAISNKTAIFRFIPSKRKLENLGRVNPTGKVTKYQMSLAMRWDLNKLYFAVGNALYSMNVITRQRKTEATNLPNENWMGSNGVDKNGNIWFGKAGANLVYRIDLKTPCPICSTRFEMFGGDSGKPEPSVRATLIGSTGPQLTAARKSGGFVFRTTGASGVASGRSILRVYDLHGKGVISWALDWKGMESSVSWTGRNARGKALPSGCYFVEWAAGTHRISRPFILMR